MIYIPAAKILREDDGHMLCPWCGRGSGFHVVDAAKSMDPGTVDDYRISIAVECELCPGRGWIHFTQHEGNVLVSLASIPREQK